MIQADGVASCLSVTFAFGVAEGHVGEDLPSQLIITSRAHENSAPIILSEVRIVTEDSSMDIMIKHDSAIESTVTATNGRDHLYHVLLREAPPSDYAFSPSRSSTSKTTHSILGSSDLTFIPSITKGFALTSLPREAGNIKAVSAILYIKERLFDLDVMVPFHDENGSEDWWLEDKAGLLKKRLSSKLGNAVKILPKPPKMYIGLPNLRSTYYTDEHVAITIHIVNEEDEEANVTLAVRLLGQSAPIPELAWASSVEAPHGDQTTAPGKVLDSQSSHLPAHHLGLLPPSASRTETILFQAEPDATAFLLEVKTLYHLSSDHETPISKTLTTDIAFIGPFESNYDFWPCVHSAPWPSYFYMNDEADNSEDVKSAQGFIQSWSLAARIASFAAEPLIIEDVVLSIIEVKNGVLCSVSSTGIHTSESVCIAPNDLQDRNFELTVQKLRLDDQRASSADLQLNVKWRRDHPGAISTVSSLAVPQLIVPFGEPRVLASVQNSKVMPGLIHLDYTLENPSMHVLTFSLTMEASEDFAFSGPKFRTLQLVPLSRHTVQYNIMPSVEGVWIQPQLRVVDVYFNKTLKVNATEGMRTDKKGILIWVDANG